MPIADDCAWLRGFWYIAVAANSVGRRKAVSVTVLGEPLLVGRSLNGAVFAYSDSCPHRGMPLRHGRFDGEHLQCCYHGWQFSAQSGACTAIPALPLSDADAHRKFRLRRFPAAESQGNIWVYMAPSHTAPDVLPDVPAVPGFYGVAPQVSTTMRFPSNADVAAMGFCDPAHPAFVHTSGWWKSKSALRLRSKVKSFEPIDYGFRMKQHQVKHGANPYRLLGFDVQVDVTLQLPGVRIEHIRGNKHSACVLAAVTPVSKTETDVHYCVYWTIPWLGFLRPIAALMAQDFLRQDLRIAEKLTLAQHHSPMMFVGDADVQVAWLLRLKREYLASQAERRPFRNPVREQTLRWNS